MKKILFFMIVMIGSAFQTTSYANVPENQGSEFSKGKIYYCDWMMTTRVSLSPDAARRSATAVITVEGSQMAPLLNLLELSEMVEKPQESGDARVVFDLEKSDGTITTYYADMFRLFNGDSSLSRNIDEKFRKNLSNFLKNLF